MEATEGEAIQLRETVQRMMQRVAELASELATTRQAAMTARATRDEALRCLQLERLQASDRSESTKAMMIEAREAKAEATSALEAVRDEQAALDREKSKQKKPSRLTARSSRRG
jgi:hypothetical protein